MIEDLSLRQLSYFVAASDAHAAHPLAELDFVEGSLVELQAMLLDGQCEVALAEWPGRPPRPRPGGPGESALSAH